MIVMPLCRIYLRYISFHFLILLNGFYKKLSLSEELIFTNYRMRRHIVQRIK